MSSSPEWSPTRSGVRGGQNDAAAGSSHMTNLDEGIIGVLIAMSLMEEEEECTSICRLPCRTSSLTGRKWVEELIQGHHNRLFENCRLDVNTFMRFCQLLRDGGYMDERCHKVVSIEESVCMFLVLASHNTRQHVLAERFQHSTETINRHVRSVVRGICELSKVLIRPRNQSSTHPRIMNDRKYYPWFKDCVGAIDGTYVAAWAPSHRRDAFQNRHGQITQNVLVACDHDMRFVFIRAGWEGSANDARVFMDAVMRENSDFPMAPEGKYYVVDSAYRNVPGFLAPYRGARYHLQDYRGRERGPRGWKELFNHRHSSIRNVIERSFGVLKRRFPFLKGPMPNYFIIRQALIVIACATVHNFIKEELPNDEYFKEHESENMVDEEESSYTNQDTQEFDTSPAAVEWWNAFRDDIASEMWHNKNVQ